MISTYFECELSSICIFHLRSKVLGFKATGTTSKRTPWTTSKRTPWAVKTNNSFFSFPNLHQHFVQPFFKILVLFFLSICSMNPSLQVIYGLHKDAQALASNTPHPGCQWSPWRLGSMDRKIHPTSVPAAWWPQAVRPGVFQNRRWRLEGPHLQWSTPKNWRNERHIFCLWTCEEL